MTKHSLPAMILLMTLLIIFSAGIAGCASQTPSASPVPDKNLSTIEPSEMILQPSEIPANFTLVEKGERNISEVSAWGLDHGWKKGYYAVYRKNDPGSPSGTVIEQYISVYPAENITLITPDTIKVWKDWLVEENNANLSLEEVPLSAIGDSGSLLKGFDKSDNSSMYLIVFVKKDVFQDISTGTNGTAADYETFRQLAGTAEAKIK